MSLLFIYWVSLAMLAVLETQFLLHWALYTMTLTMLWLVLRLVLSIILYLGSLWPAWT